jgi:hypothetical protein
MPLSINIYGYVMVAALVVVVVVNMVKKAVGPHH